MQRILGGLLALAIAALPASAGFFIDPYSFGSIQHAQYLCGHEPDCFAIDATTYNDPAYVGGPQGGTVAVRNTGDTTDNLNNVPLDASNLVNSGTSPKMVQWSEAPFVRWTPHNMVRQSQTLGTTWNASNVTIADNDTTAPDGTATADKLTSSNASNYLRMQTQGTNVVANIVYTASIYAKAGSASWMGMQLSDFSANAVNAYCDLGNGVAGTSTGYGAGDTSIANGIEDAGNGWYRCWFTFTADAFTTQPYFSIEAASADQTSGTGTVYFWGAQIVRGYNPNPYLVTTTAARIGIPQAYDTYEGKYGLQVEPGSTNLVQYSEQFDNAWWDDAGRTTADATTAPDGSTTADLFDGNSSNGLVSSTVTITASSEVTMSLYAKHVSLPWLVLNLRDAGGGADRARAWFRLSDCSLGSTATAGSGTVVAASVETVGNGWCRIKMTGTLSVTAAAFGLITATNDGDAGTIDSGDFYYWGAQLEEQGIASSYIPTLGSTVTRANDDVTAATSTTPFSATKGTVYADWKPYRRYTCCDTYPVLIDDGTANESILMYGPYAGDGQYYFDVIDGGVTQADITRGLVGMEARNQAVASWQLNDIDTSLNGGSVSSDGTATIPTVTTFNFLETSNGGYGMLYGSVYVPRQVETEGP